MKRRTWIFAVLIFAALGLAFCFPANCQSINSAVYVRNFPGTTVGQMTANAMVTCVAAPVPCILVLDPSLHSTPAGTMPTLCANCYLSDWRNGPPAGGTIPDSQCRNVTSYGAKCDGATDDTTAIQTAIFDNFPICVEFPKETQGGQAQCNIGGSGLTVDGGRVLELKLNGADLNYTGTGHAIFVNEGTAFLIDNGGFTFSASTPATPVGIALTDPVNCSTADAARIAVQTVIEGNGPAGTDFLNATGCSIVDLNDVEGDGDIDIADSRVTMTAVQQWNGASLYLNSLVSDTIRGYTSYVTAGDAQIVIDNTLTDDNWQGGGGDPSIPAPAIIHHIDGATFELMSNQGVGIFITCDANGHPSGGIEGSVSWSNTDSTNLPYQGPPTEDGCNSGEFPALNLIATELISRVATNYVTALQLQDQVAVSGHACLHVDTLGNVTQATSDCNAGVSTTAVNCLTTACAGGSTYASGTTFTNALSTGVWQQVGMTATGSCTGTDFRLVPVVAGHTLPASGITNDCAGVASVTFFVPAGATFSATASQISGGAQPFSITSWYEVQ